MDPSNASRGDEQGTRTDLGPGAGPVADRPVVDGASRTSEELRDEVERLRSMDAQRVEDLRADVAATVEELAARVNVPARARAVTRRSADRLRAIGDRARDQPAALVGAVVLLVLVVVFQRRRAGRDGRAT